MVFFSETAADIIKSVEQSSFVETFLRKLDQVPSEKFFNIQGSVVEICGDAGTGKTTLCMQLAINATNPSTIDGKVIYISSNHVLCAKRMKEIAEGAFGVNNFKWLLDERIFIYETIDLAHLFAILIDLHSKLQHPDMLNVRLIIIDSLSASFRYMFNDYGRMIRLQAELMNELKTIVDKHNILIVITNSQVNKSILSECHTFMVDKRMLLRRLNAKTCVAVITKTPSPHPKYVKFKITKDGIREV